MATARGGVNVPISATWNGRALKQAESQLGSFKKSFGKAFMGIGAAAGAAVGVTALGNALLGMAQNAAEDQKSMATLAKTMTNLNMGAAQREVEDFISTLSIQTGVVDDELRPAFDRLLRSTDDVKEAQRATTIALDAAKASGRSVVDVAMLMGKAYDGNTMALARAGFGIDTNILKTKDMTKINAELARITGGQAAVAAATYAGQLQVLNVAASEAGEAVGYELLRSLETVGNQMGGTGGFAEMITEAGDGLAGFVAGLGDATVEMISFGKAITGVTPGVDASETSFMDMLITVGKLTPGLGLVVTTTEGLVKTGQENIRVQAELADELARSATMRDIYSGKVQSSTAAMDEDTTAAERNKNAIDRLRESIDKVNGKNRSMISTNLRLRQLRAEGPDSSGGKKGNVITADDRKRFGLDYAETVSSKAELLISQGKLKKARSVLDQGRDYLGDQVGDKFANRVLATPRGLGNEIDRRDSARGANEWRTNQQTVINNFNFGDLNVASPADAVEQAKKATRLRALSNAGAVAALSDTSRNPNQGLGLIR